MPGKGYATIGLKPSIFTELKNLTNTYYPGMFLPSTLIIMMNEIKLGYYSVDSHNIRIDLSGRYNSITIRSDVKEWLEERYEGLSEMYEEKYGVKCFSRFVSYYLINMFESKINAQNHVIRLKQSDFEWLHEEYKKQQKTRTKYDISSFERFADIYLNELLEKVKTAKKILTV